MSESKQDWGQIMAVLAHYYGFKPWDVMKLSREQVDMYLAQTGMIRLARDMAQLTYHFGKLQDEDIQKMIDTASEKAEPDSLRARGWRVFIRQYQTDSAEAEKAQAAEVLPMRPETAAAIVAWVEFGDQSRAPDGSRIWREDIMPLWPRLCATADLLQTPAP